MDMGLLVILLCAVIVGVGHYVSVRSEAENQRVVVRNIVAGCCDFWGFSLGTGISQVRLNCDDHVYRSAPSWLSRSG